jgi:hypothetical protein
MSAVSGNPHRIRDAERTLLRTTVESFWTAVALVLLGLWGLHARSVRHHPDAVRADERWRHARERRGF